MAELTPWRRLEELSDDLRRQQRRLRHVLERLRHEVSRVPEYWEGNTADTFRRHVGPHHRQHHLDVAADRLRRAAHLADAAAFANLTAQHPGGGGGPSCEFDIECGARS